MDSLDDGPSVTKNTAARAPSVASAGDWLLDNLSRHKRRLVRTATRMIRRLGIDQAELEGEAAVDLAFVSLRQTLVHNPRHPCMETDAFLKLFNRAMREVILQNSRRLQSTKRGGAGRAPTSRGLRLDTGSETVTDAACGCHRVEVDLDTLASHEAPVEDAIAAKMDVETLADRLPDELHRTVLRMRGQGLLNQEIADSLGVDRHTIASKIANIRKTYQELFENQYATKTRFGR